MSPITGLPCKFPYATRWVYKRLGFQGALNFVMRINNVDKDTAADFVRRVTMNPAFAFDYNPWNKEEKHGYSR